MRPRARAHPWLMLGPTLALLVVFFLVPVLIAARESTLSWDLLTPPRDVALANYRALVRSGELVRIAARTVLFSAIVVLLSMTLGLALALLLNRAGRFFAVARAAIFTAYVVSWVSVALLWMWLLDPDNGAIAAVLRALHVRVPGFLGDPSTALVTLAIVVVWKLTGYALVVFTAGLQDVPPALLEAAALDGAGPVRRLAHVTLPALRPTAAFVATTCLIVSFQTFDVIRIMTQGGPAHATTLFVYAIYEQVFLDLRVGRASALTIVFLAVLLALSGVQLWAFRAQRSAR